MGKAPSIRARAQLSAFLEQLKINIDRSAELPGTSEKTKKDLTEALSFLVPALENLMLATSEYERLTMAQIFPGQFPGTEPFIPNTMLDLSTLLWAATTIGAFALENPDTKARLDVMRTIAATKERRSTSENATNTMRKCADEIRARDPHVSIPQVAREIAPRMFGEPGRRYRPDTIEKKLRKSGWPA